MIRELFFYDRTSPSGLRWKQNRYSWGGRKLQVRTGDVAGSPNNTGHYSVRVNGRLVKCHRIVFELNCGNIPEGLVIDHIDGNPTNNRIENLRAVPHKINCRNRKTSKKSVTGVSGIKELRYDCGTSRGFIVSWREPETSIPRNKTFSYRNFGLNCFKYACEYREQLFKRLNDEGAGYSERHLAIK